MAETARFHKHLSMSWRIKGSNLSPVKDLSVILGHDENASGELSSYRIGVTGGWKIVYLL